MVDMTASIGSLTLPNPVMTASGTSGHGAELAAYGSLDQLGAVVVKSLCVEPWPGNRAPRLFESEVGMLNSVGLQGPGLAHWIDHDLATMAPSGARVVVSVWGRRIDDYARAGELLAKVASDGAVIAVEVNVSCPNVEDRSKMFAHSPDATAAAIAALDCGLDRWAKLSPNVADITEIAGAAIDAGATALTLTNTLLALGINIDQATPVLGAGGGGLSGAGLHPVALRAVYDCRRVYPDVAIIGAGGVRDARSAVEFLMAGADAVQVGTATFANPRAPWLVLEDLQQWCELDGRGPRQLKGAALAH